MPGLSETKAGDKVAVYRGYRGDKEPDPEVAIVTRITATRIMIGPAKYKRSNGLEIAPSSEWYVDYIRPLTPAIADEIAAARAVRKECTDRLYLADLAKEAPIALVRQCVRILQEQKEEVTP